MFSSIARVHVPAEMLRLNRRQRNNSLEYFLNEIFSLTKLSSLFAGCRLTKCPFNSCKTLEEVKLLEDFRPTWNYEKLKFDPRYIKQSFAIHCPGQLYNLAKKNKARLLFYVAACFVSPNWRGTRLLQLTMQSHCRS